MTTIKTDIKIQTTGLLLIFEIAPLLLYNPGVGAVGEYDQSTQGISNRSIEHSKLRLHYEPI